MNLDKQRVNRVKKQTTLLFSILLLSTQTLIAQDIGSGAARASQTSSSNNWQSWVFATSALISAAIGVVVVSLNPGSTSH